jgi:hypothetical protein
VALDSLCSGPNFTLASQCRHPSLQTESTDWASLREQQECSLVRLTRARSTRFGNSACMSGRPCESRVKRPRSASAAPGNRGTREPASHPDGQPVSRFAVCPSQSTHGQTEPHIQDHRRDTVAGGRSRFTCGNWCWIRLAKTYPSVLGCRAKPSRAKTYAMAHPQGGRRRSPR